MEVLERERRVSIESRLKSLLTTLFLVLVVLSTVFSMSQELSVGPKVIVFNFNGETIDSGLASEIKRAIETAEEEGAILLLILDTPGGELSATESIVREILNSPVPVVGYVYPKGAAAWSAGSLILLSCHIAAMAPGTNVGAAQPVTIGPTGYEPINYSKIINPTAALFKTTAKERGRNETAAELIVRRNLTLDSEEALKYRVIDVVASNIPDLLSKINGYTVNTTAGSVKLNLKNYVLEEYVWSISGRFIHTISDPVVSQLLLMLGFYVLLLSLISAHYASAIVGVLLLLLGLVGSGFSVNLVSTILIILGFILLVIEATLIPGFGVVGVTGIIMIIAGLIMMPVYLPERWSVPPEYYSRILLAAGSITAALTGIFGFTMYKALKARLSPPKLKFTVEGKIGVAMDKITPDSKGVVLVEGEYWIATSDEEVKRGEKVVIVSKEGPIVKVKPIRESETSSS